VGVANIVTTAGDVNRRVEVGESRRLTWRPDYGWDGNLFDATAKLTAWPLNDPPDWLVASVCLASNVQYYVCAEQIPWGVTNDVYKTRKILMRRIHAAGVPWNMGAPSCEPHINRDGTRETIHTVVLTNDFYIGVYELTQAQHYYLMGARKTGSSGNYGGDAATTDWFAHPQNWIGWETMRGAAADYPWPGGHDVSPTSFLGYLRMRTGVDFDLPLDAQWEFAARGGCPYAFYNGYNMRATSDTTSDDTDAHFDEIGWFTGNSAVDGAVTTHPVGQKKPNAYGLYDMLGNVGELVRDVYNPDTLVGSSNGPEIPAAGAEPMGWADAAAVAEKDGDCYILFRGNNWARDYTWCKCANRRAIYKLSTNAWSGRFGARLWLPVE